MSGAPKPDSRIDRILFLGLSGLLTISLALATAWAHQVASHIQIQLQAVRTQIDEGRSERAVFRDWNLRQGERIARIEATVEQIARIETKLDQVMQQVIIGARSARQHQDRMDGAGDRSLGP